MTDDEFFNATSELSTIRAWARARYAAPKATLGSVMLRVAATTEPPVQLPGVIGGPASLNLAVVFVSKSGGGKGISDKIGRLAWPANIIERPIGSGEGIAAMFVPPKKDGIDPITRAILSVPEIDTLAGVAARQGSILLAQLKSALMGELLGQSNASEATTRIVQAHTYRCCLSIGAQPGHADVIFNDTTGGTPQRLLWLPTTDPHMPADRTPDPEPLNVSLPSWARTGTEITYGPDSIREAIIEAHLARQRGEGNALDGHALLTRCKVAAVLAILHHRSVVSELDWDLSGTVMGWSNTTRDWIIDQAKMAARAKVRDRALARAVGEEFIDQRRIEVVKRRVLKVLQDGAIARGELRARMGKKEYRELLEAATAELAESGAIVRVDAKQGGTHFEMNHEFSPEPQFSPHSRSSEVLNREFSPEPSATVTDLDSRRSPEVHQPTLSAPKWLENHLAKLRAEGHDTAESFAVIEAGQAEGYSDAALRTAASKSPLVKVIGRGPRTSVWDITGGNAVYKTAGAWVQEYIDNLPAGTTEIDRDAFREAAEAARYTWTAARHAALDHPRIRSAPAEGDSPVKRIWVLRADHEEGSAS